MKFLTVLFLGCLCCINVKGQLVINEIMQSNVNCIMDDLNEYPDSWVELYNPGNTNVSLAGYSIGDKDKSSKAYMLPSSLTVPPGGYILVYCDKEGSKMHASFRLESGKGCNVYLFKDGEIVDKIEDLKKMPAPDISYGRKNDGSDEWGYQLTPTPGKENCGALTDLILDEPVFSLNGRVMTSRDVLRISLPENAPENAVIRYTLDGSEPTEFSEIWENPLEIYDNTVVRAKLFADGYLSPLSTTHSYIFHGYDMTLPIISIVGNEDDFYSDEKGILSGHQNEAGKENFMYDWRRPINFEFFTKENRKAELNQICETRLKGHYSRLYLIKSMVVYANKRFGTKRLEYEFFPDQKEGLTDFKSIELRNAGQDCNYTYMKDAVIQRTMGMNCDLDWQASQPAVVYLNGKYHGILNIRERANEDFIYTNYDGIEDVDIIENWRTVEEGEMDEFNKFRDFYNEDDHSYEEFAALMDIPEFFNYFIMNIFYSNRDFPGNNCIMWRQQVNDGKWRWIGKDTDLGLGLYNSDPEFPTFEWYYDPEAFPALDKTAGSPYATLLLRRLLATTEGKKEFLDRFLVYMGDFLNETITSDVIDDFVSMLEVEYPRHSDKNVEPNYRGGFSWMVPNMKTWVRTRQEYMPIHLSEFFGMNKCIPVYMNVADVEGLDAIFINDIPLVNNIFDGNYFSQTPFTIQALNNDDSYLFNWEVKLNVGTDKEQTLDYSGDTLEYIIPSNAEYVEICLASKYNDIETDIVGNVFDDSDFDINKPYDVYDLQGRKINRSSVDGLPKGMYMIKQGSKSFKIII